MITSISTQKGGTGKTTTTISLSSLLAIQGKRVLLVDIDSQANSSKVLVEDYQNLSKEQSIYNTILNRKPLPIRPSKVENLDIVPAHILLSNTDIELTTAKDHREARLKNQLDRVRGNYDYIFIDCPPALSWLTVNAFTASDEIIIVVAPGYFELDSIVQINKTIEEVQDFFNPDLKIRGYLFNMSDPTNVSIESLKLLRQAYTGQVFKTVIPRNTDIRDAHLNREVIHKYNPQSKSAIAYQKFVEELYS